MRYCASICTFNGDLRMYSSSPFVYTVAGAGTIHVRNDMQSPESPRQKSAPSALSGWISLPVVFFSVRSACNSTRPASVRPSRESTMRSGSFGLRLTQKVEGSSSSQVKNESDACAAWASPVSALPCRDVAEGAWNA